MIQKPISVIRKISVGADYKNSMVYLRGQKTFGDYVIGLIEQTDNGNILVYIVNTNQDVLLWKEFSVNLPIVIEFYIEYEK